jgi:ribonuclease Z
LRQTNRLRGCEDPTYILTAPADAAFIPANNPQRKENMSIRRVIFLLAACFTLVAASQLPSQEITVTLLGTGSPILLPARSGPAILVQAGGQNILFDVGRGAAGRLWQAGVPLRDIDAVFFTHLHSDHITGFPDLWLTGMLPNKSFAHRVQPLRVYGPVGTRAMAKYLALAYQADVRIRQADEHTSIEGARIIARDIHQGVVYEKDGVKVTAFDVDHGELIKPSLGYRVDYRGRSVVLSGDTRPSDNLVRFAMGTDVLFHEVAAARPELLALSDAARRIIGHHTTPEQATVVFSKVHPRLAVFTHIVLLSTDPRVPPPTIEDVGGITAARYKARFEIGEDLMRISVDDSIIVTRPSAAPDK